MEPLAYVAATSRVPLHRIREGCEKSGVRVVAMQEEARLPEELAAARPDVVFLQASIVEEAGLDLVSRIKAHPELGEAYVYIFAAREEGADFASRIGADGFIPVPFAEGQLAAILRLIFGRPRKVLLVGSATEEMERLRRALVRDGYQLDRAETADSGWRATREGVPDLVICAQDLPDSPGLELCRRIKGTRLLHHVPLLLLLRECTAEAAEQCFEEGIERVLLPPFDGEPNRAVVAEVSRPPRRGRLARALVVDDSPSIRNLVAKMLRQLGFTVLTAADGQQGLAVARRERPALITTDYEMPVMTGWDLCRALARDSELRHIPVVMITSLGSAIDRKKGALLGVSAYLTKPFTSEVLQQTVTEVLGEAERSRTERSLARYVAADALASVRQVVRGLKEEEPEEKLITILFSDIVRFSTMCERLSPREVVQILNAYFDRMVDVLLRHHAIIDKMIGDAIVARFDRGDAREDALDAVQAALAMLSSLEEANRTAKEPLQIRLGINSGEVILGNLGCSQHRLDYTMIGDNVNIAARLESIASSMGCLISESVWRLVEGRVLVGEPMDFTVRSKTVPVRAYRLLALRER